MVIIYGVDTKKPFTAADVRDAIVLCFTQAHKEVLDELKKYSKEKITPQEWEEMKKINVRQLIRGFFKKVGGDYDKPTKYSLLLVINELANFASNFRSQKIIEKHYHEIQKLIDKLEE